MASEQQQNLCLCCLSGPPADRLQDSQTRWDGRQQPSSVCDERCWDQNVTEDPSSVKASLKLVPTVQELDWPHSHWKPGLFSPTVFWRVLFSWTDSVFGFQSDRNILINFRFLHKQNHWGVNPPWEDKHRSNICPTASQSQPQKHCLWTRRADGASTSWCHFQMLVSRDWSCWVSEDLNSDYNKCSVGVRRRHVRMNEGEN